MGASAGYGGPDKIERGLRKRSVTIAGHRTSISLEPEFWAALEALAASRHWPLARLIGEIDRSRAGGNLSSALRVYLLAEARRARGEG
jgi:predicted DNA-binding ribbon-helix-helix protein